MRIFLPKLLIIIIEAHKWKYDLKKNNIKSWLQQDVHVTLGDAASKKQNEISMQRNVKAIVSYQIPELQRRKNIQKVRQAKKIVPEEQNMK